jgi:RNA polymerase sigma-70 factor (ECF subfamily)
LDREEDFELVRQLGSRNREVSDSAFSQLYDKYEQRVFATALRIMGDSALAADATQLAFITVLRKARKFNFRSAFSSWLYRVAVNRCIDLKRKGARHRTLSMNEPEVARIAEGGDTRRAGIPGPEAHARHSELVLVVGQAISRLNPRLSVVVVLRYLEGLGYEEIAEILEVPLGTVKSRLNRAHAALEKDLGPRLDSLS